MGTDRTCLRGPLEGRLVVGQQPPLEVAFR